MTKRPVHVRKFAKKNAGKRHGIDKMVAARREAARKPHRKQARGAEVHRKVVKRVGSTAAAKPLELQKRSTAKRGLSPVIASQEEVKEAVDGLLGNSNAVAFLRKNVSKWAPDVLNMLPTPKTDDYLAEQLGMKINAIRRILNLMQGYGITNYYVAKNTNGWLSFAWYVNTSKIPPFFDYINNVANRKTVINQDCNDYFVCNSCYQKDRLIFTFDAAFEAAFKCNCGHDFTRIGKEAAERLVEEEQTDHSEPRVDAVEAQVSKRS